MRFIFSTGSGKTMLLTCLVFVICMQAISQRPNIVYIMSDDMGYGDLSCYGRKEYQTPNLDMLAAKGVKFVNAYSAAPVCTPTRAALMTGRYPARIPVGLLEPLVPSKIDSTYGLSSQVPSVASLMKKAGYETALIGKWHLGFRPEFSPTENGFDYYFGIHSGAADYISHKNGNRTHDLYENKKPVYPEGYMTDLISDKASSFIRQEHNKPFFLAVTFTAPHWPWQGPGDQPYHDTLNFRAGGSPTVYAAMMKSLDDGIGKIIKALEEKNLAGQTLIIFTNDNGGEKYSDNGGLSKAKFTLWEGGIRVPAIIRWDGKIVPGNTTQQVAVTMDWTATILSAGHAKAGKGFPLDGIDLLPIVTRQEAIVERTIYWRTAQRTKQKAMRMGNWKYLQDEKGEYLFNLDIDQGEKNDIKAENPAIYTQLKNKYADWEKTVLAPIPLNQN